MSFLVDTHIFLDYTKGSQSLNPKFLSILESHKGPKFLSIISVWEIGIKVNIGKLELYGTLEELMALAEDMRFSFLNVNRNHILTYTSLPLIHRDPFDRMIIAQAVTEKMHLLTDDKMMQSYPEVTFFA